MVINFSSLTLNSRVAPPRSQNRWNRAMGAQGSTKVGLQTTSEKKRLENEWKNEKALFFCENIWFQFPVQLKSLRSSDNIFVFVPLSPALYQRRLLWRHEPFRPAVIDVTCVYDDVTMAAGWLGDLGNYEKRGEGTTRNVLWIKLDGNTMEIWFKFDGNFQIIVEIIRKFVKFNYAKIFPVFRIIHQIRPTLEE